MPTKPILRVAERVVPAQDLEITEIAHRVGTTINVMLSDGRLVFLPPDVQTKAYLNHLYSRIASERTELNATKEDIPIEETPTEVTPIEVGLAEEMP